MYVHFPNILWNVAVLKKELCFKKIIIFLNNTTKETKQNENKKKKFFDNSLF